MDEPVIKSQLTAREVSAARIGQLWRQEDHEVVTRQLTGIEQLAAALDPHGDMRTIVQFHHELTSRLPSHDRNPFKAVADLIAECDLDPDVEDEGGL